MLPIIILAAAVCLAELFIIICLTNANRKLEERYDSNVETLAESYNKKLKCIGDEYERKIAENRKKLDSVHADYQNFKSHVHVIEAEAPSKKSVVYSAVKLSAYLDKYISYNESKGTCSLVVLDIDLSE